MRHQGLSRNISNSPSQPPFTCPGFTHKSSWWTQGYARERHAQPPIEAPPQTDDQGSVFVPFLRRSPDMSELVLSNVLRLRCWFRMTPLPERKTLTFNRFELRNRNRSTYLAALQKLDILQCGIKILTYTNRQDTGCYHAVVIAPYEPHTLCSPKGKISLPSKLQSFEKNLQPPLLTNETLIQTQGVKNHPP